MTKNKSEATPSQEKTYKCYGVCEKKYPKSQLFLFRKKNHCQDCITFITRLTAERDTLYSYIQRTYNLKYPTGFMMKQIKDFRETRGYSYTDIQRTLEYVFDVRKSHKPITKYGVSAVPHYIDEMKRYYDNLEKKRLESMGRKQNAIRIVIPPYKIPENRNTRKLINMEDLLDD